MRTTTVVACAALFLAACSSEPDSSDHVIVPATTPPTGGSTPPPDETPTTLTADTEAQVAVLRAFVEEFSTRDEHDADTVAVQHLLVSFRGAGVPGVERTKEEAEQLAAQLWSDIRAGEDFDALVREHTDDSYPGTYTMVATGGRPPATFNRGGMVPAFGNVGWRLEVGEFGVAAYDPQKSPYGWHIVQRTE